MPPQSGGMEITMAINMVMKHYEGYIAKLATRKMYDDCLDMEIQERKETVTKYIEALKEKETDIDRVCNFLRAKVI